MEVRDQGKNVGLILSHDIQNKLHSDADFGEEFLEQDPLSNEITALAVDGAYYRQSSLQKAKEKEIEMNVSNMTGRKPLKEKLPVDQFHRDEN